MPLFDLFMSFFEEFRDWHFVSRELFQSRVRIEFHFPLLCVFGEHVHEEHFLESSIVFAENSLHVALSEIQVRLVNLVVNHKIRICLEISVRIFDSKDFEFIFELLDCLAA